MRYLSEPLEVQYEHIRQRPEAEFNTALLQLLAVRTSPGIVWGQLKHTHSRSSSHQGRAATTMLIKQASLTTRPSVSPSLPPLCSRAVASKSNHNVYVGLCLAILFYSKHSIRSQTHRVKPQRVKGFFSRRIIIRETNGRLTFFPLTCAKADLRFIFRRQTARRSSDRRFVWRERARRYLLLLSVKLEALGEGAGLWLVMLFPVQIHALSIRNVLLLSVSKQAADKGKTQSSIQSVPQTRATGGSYDLP